MPHPGSLVHPTTVIARKYALSFLRLFLGALLLASAFPALAQRTITLEWNPSPSADVVDYNVYYGDSARAYTNTVATGGGTTVTISNLVVGATYYFAATAVDVFAGESDYSEEISYTVSSSVLNSPPTLDSLANLTINEDSGLQTVSLTGISSGAASESQTLTVTATSSAPGLIPNPTVTYASPASTGSLSFTPAANANGTATITVTVNDGGSSNDIVSKTFSVTVNPVNDSPTFAALANLTINANSTAQTVNLRNISSGAANESQTLSVTATSSNPSLIPTPTVTYSSPATAGTLTFTPVASMSGTATITVTVNDGGSVDNTGTRSFVVTVVPVNQAPTLDTLANVTINEDSGLRTVSLTGISSGAANESQTLTVTATSSAPGLIPNPTVTYTSPASTGSLTFTPAANANGAATITVTVNDGGSSNNVVSKTFSVTVNPVNDPPTFAALANLTINENATAQTVNLSNISSGATNESQTLSVTATSSNPALIPAPTVTYSSPATTGTLTLTPVASMSGTATITVTVNDGSSANNTGTGSFVVTVVPVNQTPTLDSLANLTINEDSGLQTVSLSGISPGAASESQTLTVTASSSAPGLIPNPTVTYSSPATTGTLTFTPAANANGTATITVTVNDGGSSNNIVSRTFSVTVNPVNDPPTFAALASLTISENATAQTVNLSNISSGATNESQTLSVTATSSNPSLIPAPTVNYSSPATTGTLTFTPVASMSGTATITVTVNDGSSANNTGSRSFVVTVVPVNQTPTLDALANLTINEDSGLQTVSLTGISSGAASESQTLTVTATSSAPSLIPNPTVTYSSPATTGTLSFTPAANANGTATITVTVNDAGSSNNVVSRMFSVTVNPVNDPPTIATLANLTINANSTAQTVNLSGISSGATNENQTLSVTATSSNPALIPNPTVTYSSPATAGTLTFTPVASMSGTATITVTVNDGSQSSSKSFVVTVNAVPVQSELTFAASSGTISAPFVVNGGAVSQPAKTTVTTGGKAVYNFSLAAAGNYTVSMLVYAQNSRCNALYVNIDGEPLDPTMIWDVPVTKAFKYSPVSWRGTGTESRPQFAPKVFTLSAGAHQLIVRGLERQTAFSEITISPVTSAAPAAIAALPPEALPSLSIEPAYAGVIISWPSSAATWTLEQKEGIDGEWTPVQATPKDDGTRVSVQLSPASESGFYRLRQP